jgi:hypothetical protein
MILKEMRHNQPRSIFPPKVAISTPFRSVLPPSGQPTGSESSGGHPLSGTLGNVVRSFRLRHAPRPHAPHAPRRRGQRVQAGRRPSPAGYCRGTDRRIAKERTGPDLNERPLYFSMSPNRAIPAPKIQVGDWRRGATRPPDSHARREV